MLFLRNSGESWDCGAGRREGSSRENCYLPISEELSGVGGTDSTRQAWPVGVDKKREAGLGQ